MSSSSAVAISSPVSGDLVDHRNQVAGSRRRDSGVYYTPPALARVLAEWALEHHPKRILEPSFGDGVFLRAARDAMRKASVPNPEKRLFGVEIDPESTKRVQASGLVAQPSQLQVGDLLGLEAKELGGRFGAIIGNPPYVRHHRLDEKLAERGRASARSLGIELNGRSDAWAYFCAHLTSFLQEDGRLALVLPGSILHADYAEPLLSALGTGHGETQLIRIRKRVFSGVQERTVVLLVDRSKTSNAEWIPRQLADVAALGRALKGQRRARAAGTQSLSSQRTATRANRSRRDDTRLPWRLSRKEAELYEGMCAHETVRKLGELVTIRIGVVTGANDFFVRSVDEVEALSDEVRSLPIVSRGRWLQAPRWRAADQRAVADKPSRLLLLDPTKKPGADLGKEIEYAEHLGLHRRHHCSKREPWYAILDTQAPQLFLPYMGSTPPQLIVNDVGATCTNAVHRLQKLDTTKASIRAIAAGSWTTLYTLSAELAGRSYGGGVLKLEPGGAARTQLPLPSSAEMLGEIAEGYEQGGFEAARRAADHELLIVGLGLNYKELECLRNAARRLRELRRQ